MSSTHPSSPGCLESLSSAITVGRPKSLVEVVAQSETGLDLDSCLREFLDEFYLCTVDGVRAGMLQEPPPMQSDERVNAYLGAVAEHLSRRNRLPVPHWVHHESRFLRRAFFPCGLESLKATLLMESPTAFRRRMIFVGADPLYRPRRSSESMSRES